MAKILIKGFVLTAIMSMLLVSTAYAGTIQAIGGNSTVDQDFINAAIAQAQPGDIVRLSGDYVISGPIYMKSGISLLGDGTATITATPRAFSTSGAGMIIMKDVSNVEIGNFVIDGGEVSRSIQYGNSGHGWESGIVLSGRSSNCTIHNIFFTMLNGDGVRATGDTSYITVKDCVMDTTGHDGVQAWGGEYWLVQNCSVNLFINSGVRYANTVNSIIQNCEFYCNTGSGFCGVELEDDVSGDSIQNCNFHDLNNAYNTGIMTVHATGNINVYNNTFTNCRDMSVSGIIVTKGNNTVGEYGSHITQSKSGATVCMSGSECARVLTPYGIMESLTPYGITISLVSGYANQSIENADLAGAMMNESAADVQNAMKYANTTEGQPLAVRLVEESKVKQEFAQRLMQMSLEDLNSSRDLVNATMAQVSGYENVSIPVNDTNSSTVN